MSSPIEERTRAVDDSISIRIAFTDEDPDEVLSALKEAGAEDVEQVQQRGLTGIEFVVIGVLVAKALTALVIRLAPLWKCGVLVDARGSRVRTEKNCDLPRGSVLFIGKDGAESTLHEPSEPELKSLIGRLLSGAS